MKRIKSISRLFEQILGFIGSFLSIVSGSFILFIESGGHQGNSTVAVLAIIGSLLGFLSTFYVNRDIEAAGVGFIIAAILILIGTPRLGIIGSALILVAGISALFRK